MLTFNDVSDFLNHLFQGLLFDSSLYSLLLDLFYSETG